MHNPQVTVYPQKLNFLRDGVAGVLGRGIRLSRAKLALNRPYKQMIRPPDSVRGSQRVFICGDCFMYPASSGETGSPATAGVIETEAFRTRSTCRGAYPPAADPPAADPLNSGSWTSKASKLMTFSTSPLSVFILDFILRIKVTFTPKESNSSRGDLSSSFPPSLFPFFHTHAYTLIPHTLTTHIHTLIFTYIHTLLTHVHSNTPHMHIGTHTKHTHLIYSYTYTTYTHHMR